MLYTRHVGYAAFAFGAAMLVLAAAATLLTVFPIAVFVGLTSVAFITVFAWRGRGGGRRRLGLYADRRMTEAANPGHATVSLS